MLVVAVGFKINPVGTIFMNYLNLYDEKTTGYIQFTIPTA